MTKPNPNLHPPSGWQIPVESGITLAGKDKQELIEKLAYWNAARGINSDPEQQIDSYICETYPYVCRETGSNVRSASPGPALAAKRLEYLNRTYRTLSSKKPVDGTEVERRLNACLKCPLRADVPVGCVPCGDNSAFLRNAMINRFPAIKVTIPVACCSAYGTDLPIFLRLPADEDKQAPPNCWRLPRYLVPDSMPVDSSAGAGIP